jgi:hypothetical protein
VGVGSGTAVVGSGDGDRVVAAGVGVGDGGNVVTGGGGM